MKETPFDPKLKAAAEEIKEILKKYDAQGTMLLVSPSHAEFLFHVDTSWSVLKVEVDAADPEHYQLIRFRSKREDFPSKEAQIAAVTATVHGITSTLQFGRLVQQRMQELLDELGKHMKITFAVWGDKPDDVK
jgi:hypothetical protein